MGAERQVGGDAAVAAGQLWDHLAPQISVDQQSVDEDDGFARAPFAVADGALAEIDFLELAEIGRERHGETSLGILFFFHAGRLREFKLTYSR